MKESHIAHEAQTRLPEMSEVNLESCQGVPDQHSRFGTMDILIYAATSASSDNYSLPVVGGISFSNGAYCQAIFGLKNGCVTHIIYFADTNATGAPDAYCAPIMRTCLAHLGDKVASGTQ